MDKRSSLSERAWDATEQVTRGVLVEWDAPGARLRMTVGPGCPGSKEEKGTVL